MINTKKLAVIILIVLLVVTSIMILVKMTETKIKTDSWGGDELIDINATTIKIEGRRYHVDRGHVWVKLDHSLDESTMLKLPIIRYKAWGNASKEPIFYLGGGPGMTNMKFKPHPDLFENRDLVLVGFRGVDGSIKLNSKEISKALKGNGKDLLSVDSLQSISNASIKYISSLHADGIDLSNFTIADMIEDLEAVRKMFGYDLINIRAGSFGTRVAIFYEQKYPHNVNRSVYNATNLPGGFIWYPRDIDNLLRELSELRKAWGSSQDFYENLKSSLENMPQKWMTNNLDPGKIKVVTFLMLFDLSRAPHIMSAYDNAAKGDYSGLWLLSKLYDLMVPSMFAWGDMASKALSVDHEYIARFYDEIDTDIYPFGSPFSQLLLSMSDSMIGEFKDSDSSYNEVTNLDGELLLINGDMDISTPLYNAFELQGLRPNSSVVIATQRGHLGIFKGQNKAYRQLIVDYYDFGEVNTDYVIDIPLSFDLIFANPLGLIAKGIVALIIGGVLIIGWLGIRFAKRRVLL